MFTVKLDAIDATQKAKIIREVKAMMPNMNLVEVGQTSYRDALLTLSIGQEVCRVHTPDPQGEHAERGCREVAEDVAGDRGDSLAIIGLHLYAFSSMRVFSRLLKRQPSWPFPHGIGRPTPRQS